MNQATHLYREGMAELREENEQLKARIAELEKQSEHWHSLYQVKSDLLDGCERGFTPELEQLQKRIAELESKQRWIPVSERLPENNQQVLSTDGQDYYLDYYAQWDGANLSFAPRFLGAPWKVTHWMPLPEVDDKPLVNPYDDPMIEVKDE